MGGRFSESGSEGHGDCLSEDEPVGGLEIFEHASGVDFEMRKHSREVMESAAGEAHDFGEGFPFGVPTTQAALVFLNHGTEQRADETGNAIGGGENYGAGYGIAFLRHGGRSAAARRGRLEEFGDFGLRVERNVARNFAESAGKQAEGGGDFGDAVAMAVPWKKGKRQKKVVSEKFRDLRTFFAKRRQRADGAAELQCEDARANFGQALAMAQDSIQPAGGDYSEGGGKRLLHPCAGGDWRGAMRIGECGESGGELTKILIEKFEGAAKLENRGGVGDVLTGGSPMDITSGFPILLGDEFGEHFDERDGDIAREGCGFLERSEIEIFRAALCGDCARGGLGNNCGGGFGTCEAGFEEQHALDGFGVGEYAIEGVVVEERVEKSHGVMVQAALE